MLFADANLRPNRIELARRRTAGYVDLTSSNPTTEGLLFPPEILADAAARYLRARRYTPDPHGLPAARAALVEYYASRTAPLALDPADLFLTASTSEAYGLLFALLAEPGDNLLAPDVTYPLFEYLAQVYRLELRTYRLDPARGWGIDEASLLAAADSRTRAVLLVSPHNPTGAVIQRPVPALTQLRLPLIADEVFAPFALGAPYVPPLGALHPELAVFHLNGISKLFALPDMKLGWVALSGPAREYAPRLELLNDTFLGANMLSQQLLPTLFAEGTGFLNAMVGRVRASVDGARARLAACDRVRLGLPDGGYYLFPEILGWDDEEDLVLRGLSGGVLVHPGFFYGAPPGCHLLLSCLTEPSRLAAGLERLVTVLAELPD